MTSPAGVFLETFYGAGHIVDVTNGLYFNGFNEISIEAVMKEAKRPYGNEQLLEAAIGQITGYEGTASWWNPTAEQIAVLLGGTLTKDKGVSYANESFTVPSSSPYTVTLANAATCIDASIAIGGIYLKSPTGVIVRPTIVSGSPANTGEVKVASGVLTFHSSAADYTGAVFYLYTDAVGRKVVPSIYSTSQPFEAYFSLFSYGEENANRPVVVHAKSVQWTGNIKIGATRGNYDGAITRAFSINVATDGDLAIYFK